MMKIRFSALEKSGEVIGNNDSWIGSQRCLVRGNAAHK
jgi:hypothetical protein